MPICFHATLQPFPSVSLHLPPAVPGLEHPYLGQTILVGENARRALAASEVDREQSPEEHTPSPSLTPFSEFTPAPSLPPRSPATRFLAELERSLTPCLWDDLFLAPSDEAAFALFVRSGDAGFLRHVRASPPDHIDQESIIAETVEDSV